MARIICSPAHPEACAQVAGLNYVSDTTPGIRRIGSGKNFRYKGPSGRMVRDIGMLNRIKRLAIPPAWTDVWISPDPDGHLQAVGRDARGRKQYRYHRKWRAVRDDAKYHRFVEFARALPRLRRRVDADLACTCLCKTKV